VSLDAPKSVLIIRPDAMGDLVLFTPTLQALLEIWPKTAISVIIQKSHSSLAKILFPQVNWITIDFDPWKKNPFEAKPAIESVRKLAATLNPDFLIAACTKRSWLDSVIADAIPNAKRFAFKTNTPDPYWNEHLLWATNKQTYPTFETIASEGPGEQDWQKNLGLITCLTGKTVNAKKPVITLPKDVLLSGEDTLKQLNISTAQYAVCAVAGSVNVKIKSWPTSHYAKVIDTLSSTYKIKTLLVAHLSEKETVDEIKQLVQTKDTASWLGSDNDLPLLTALINQSSFYFGNDTGAMHLAAACDKPVLGIFGGGTWPRFIPAANRFIALHIPMPCYGCNWDCPFGDAPCIKSIPVDRVTEAIDTLLNTKHSLNEVRALPPTSLNLDELVKKASEKHQALTRIQQEREATLIKTAIQAGEKDKVIENLHQVNEEINNARKESSVQLDLMRRAADVMMIEIKSQTQHSESKDKLIKSLHADNLMKQDEITHLLDEIEVKDASILSLHEANEAKLETLKIQSAALLEKEAMIADLAKACEERLVVMKHMEAEIARLSGPKA